MGNIPYGLDQVLNILESPWIFISDFNIYNSILLNDINIIYTYNIDGLITHFNASSTCPRRYNHVESLKNPSVLSDSNFVVERISDIALI